MKTPSLSRLAYLAVSAAAFIIAPSPTTAATVLLVVANSGSLNAQESAKKTLIEGWGHTVVPISGSASQASYDAAVLTSSVAFICETVLSSDLGTKLLAAPIGVVDEEAALSDEFGLASSYTTFSGSQVNIINTSHYITSTLPAGTTSLFTASQPVRYLSGTLGGFTVLGQQISTSNPTFVVMEYKSTLTPSGNAAGRRVFLPWGNTGMDVNALTTDGKTIVRRSLEWALLPLAHWKLDDASGSTAVDWIGGHNGTVNGAGWTTGKLTGGLKLDGVDDYVTISNHSIFQVTSALTVAGWIKGTTWSSGSWASPVLRKGDANPNNWQLAVCDGHIALALDDFDAGGIRGSTLLNTNQWYHVAATWDGSKVRIYLNGALDNAPTTRNAPIGTDSRAVYIGGRTGASDVVNGSLDDVRFYNRALTAEEVAALARTTPRIIGRQAAAPQ